MTPDEIYVEGLFSLGYGFPLRQGDPLDEYEGVRPGDAGEIVYVSFAFEWIQVLIR